MWPRTFSTISSWLKRKRNSLIYCRNQQKIHETHKICFWLERIRSWHMEFAYLLYNSTEKCMKLTKFGILANKTTFSFTSIRESNISRGCAKSLEILEGTGVNFRCRFWKNSEGRGAIRQIPSVGVVWIFSETTHFSPFNSLDFSGYC